MSPSELRFAQVDVFSATPYLGNPVAVVLDADALSDDQMQRIARWTNLSETTFVLKPTTPAADYRLRIFTPGGELPFAGHPTLGSAHAWLENGGTPQAADALVQECGAGLVSIRVESNSQGNANLAFKAPPTLRTGPLEPELVGRIAAAFGIAESEIVAHQWVDNGPGWACAQLASAAQVLSLEPKFDAGSDLKLGVIGAYPAGSAAAFEVRAFAPAMGLFEDPVTGSLNASIAQWLFRTGAVSGSYAASQGQRLGRQGIINLEQDDSGEVWVGGATATCIRGTIKI